MMKRITGFVTCAVMIVGLLAGCGRTLPIDSAVPPATEEESTDSVDNNTTFSDTLSESTASENYTDSADSSDYAENGLAVSYKNGYYGYVNEAGEEVIGYYYDAAEKFIGNRAVVKTGNLYGVIDEQGNDVIPPIYKSIRPCEYCTEDGNELLFFIVEEESTEYPRKDYIGVCNSEGELIVDTTWGGAYYTEGTYADFSIDQGMIWGWAAVSIDNDGPYLNQDALIWRKVFDLDGNPVVGPGETDGKEIDWVSTLNNGKYLVYSGGMFYYLNENFQRINNAEYSHALSFNRNGYALAEYVYDGNLGYDRKMVVVSSDGAESAALPYLKNVSNVTEQYEYCNSFFASTVSPDNPKSTTNCALVNLETMEIKEYKSTQFIPGTNCIIVSDPETGLYGLYDGNDLVLECKYNQMETVDWPELSIEAQRGAETTQYIPRELTENTQNWTKP